jgi:hypothetical protein
VFSNASYGDDASSRRSSEGFVVYLYGTIDWRATKQTTVTKSITEAELLALSHASSELMWWQRFIKRLRIIKPPKEPILYCDNWQTLRIINNHDSKIDTKLRYVDIYQY